MIALSSSATLLKVPRRMRFSVILAKKRSTMLSHDDEVGVKCKWKRECALSVPTDSTSDLAPRSQKAPASTLPKPCPFGASHRADLVAPWPLPMLDRSKWSRPQAG